MMIHFRILFLTSNKNIDCKLILQIDDENRFHDGIQITQFIHRYISLL